MGLPLHRACGTIDNLIAIAAGAGLPREEAKEVLLQRQYREAVDADWQRSRDLGVTGVPTFVISKLCLVGAQPYEQLEMLLVESGIERRAT